PRKVDREWRRPPQSALLGDLPPSLPRAPQGEEYPARQEERGDDVAQDAHVGVALPLSRHVQGEQEQEREKAPRRDDRAGDAAPVLPDRPPRAIGRTRGWLGLRHFASVRTYATSALVSSSESLSANGFILSVPSEAV